MKKKILAFGASTNSKSINRKLANYAAHQIPDAEVNLIDLNDFEMPIYSQDREIELGFPEEVHRFKDHIKNSVAIVISFAEHNGAYSAAFKNIFDWASRIERDLWENKPMFLLATSPGARGGRTVLDIAVNKFQFMNQNTIVSFSLPSFHTNFSEEEGIIDADLSKNFREKLDLIVKAI